MNLDPRKSEHSLASYSPVKHNQSQALKDEVEAFLAQGGQIRQISNQTHGDFVSPCFNKSKESLQRLQGKLNAAYSCFTVTSTVFRSIGSKIWHVCAASKQMQKGDGHE